MTVTRFGPITLIALMVVPVDIKGNEFTSPLSRVERGVCSAPLPPRQLARGSGGEVKVYLPTLSFVITAGLVMQVSGIVVILFFIQNKKFSEVNSSATVSW